MSTKDVAREAGVSPSAVRAAIKKGTLRAKKFEGLPDWDIERGDYEAWMAKKYGDKRGPKARVE